MGNDNSKAVRQHELVAQQGFPRVINTRFVHHRVVSLRLQNGFWSHSDPQALEILDIDSNKVMFKIPPQLADPSSGRKQLLLDHNGVPIVTMDEFPVGNQYAMYIPAVPLPVSVAVDKTTIANRALCYLETSTRPMEWPLYLELPDLRTGGKVNIVVDGVWRSHRAIFWLNRGARMVRSCIARVYITQEEKENNKKNGGAASYRLDIAAGVDVALIVLACAALDQALATKESGQAVPIPTDDTTLMLAERHHGMESQDRKEAKVGKGLFISTFEYPTL